MPKPEYCPDIQEVCDVECRDWNEKEDDCNVRISQQRALKQADQQDVDRKSMTEYMAAVQGFLNTAGDSIKKAEIQQKAIYQAMLNNPMVPEGDKEILAKILEAPSSEVAENLLKEFTEGQEKKDDEEN